MLWMVIFFVSFLFPIVTGILLNSVKAAERPLANSLSNLIFSIFGYMPAPLIYGIVSESRYGLGIILYSTVISTTFLLLALICKLKRSTPKTVSGKGRKPNNKDLEDMFQD